MDATVARANRNTECIQDLHNQLGVAMAKIDDLENRSRKYNFRIRGLPESITEIQSSPSSWNFSLIFAPTDWNWTEHMDCPETLW